MKIIRLTLSLLVIFLLYQCGTTSDEKADKSSRVTTPVSVLGIENASISESVSFNAVSSYQRKNSIRSNISGYVMKSHVNQGDKVKVGQLLYTIRTKEGEALSHLTLTDSSLAFKGEQNITAPTSGIVLEANKHTNDYVSDGDQLCSLADLNSFVFSLNVPFEQNKLVSIGKKCSIILSDSTILVGTIAGKLASIDPVSQTQSYLVKAVGKNSLPENLSVVVQITTQTKPNAQVIDKSCILSDETMEKYWVMRLLNDSIAIRTPIQLGLKAGRKIEILSPIFKVNEQIISKGQYGLPDTAYVTITQP
jgi:HlyD family secretion protein